MESKKKIYIAGKISDLPTEDYTANFEKAESFLKSKGYEPVNPVHIGSENFCEKLNLLLCVAALKDCDGIYMLTNWEQSYGAMLEKIVAEIIKKYDDNFLILFQRNFNK